VNAPAAPPAPARIPWRRTLLFRVMMLCAVLLVCLFAAVILITQYFLREAAAEMQAQTADIVKSLELQFGAAPDLSLDQARTGLMTIHEGVDIQLQPYTGRQRETVFSIETTNDGSLVRVAQVPVLVGDNRMLMTARVTIAPQVEILRALTNSFLGVIVLVFVMALAAMLYFIQRALRPLSQLSETCAAVSTGELRTVSTRGATGEVRALEETFNQMVASLRDKELMEMKLRQAQRLSALGNLAAGVAHDVRNPLNAIKLLSSHAIDQLPNDETGAAKHLQTIRREVDRLDAIVSSFMSLAKERELSPEPRKIDLLLDECVHLLQKEAESRGVALVRELRAGDTLLMLDAREFQRAIMNVLLNALEACPPGGRVRMFSRLTATACEVEVRDDGPGMDRAQLERVFEPYYTTKPGGTGLGLSITRGIIEEHGGAIEMSSIEGTGCQVLITLPLTRAGVR
jgi:signal transduction histidine kinase